MRQYDLPEGRDPFVLIKLQQSMIYSQSILITDIFTQRDHF